ncbi:MAG: glycoside hydrolase family 3 protein [Clostridia bacterium]|nr:glycoside hydrolase family 3 protein [Clostridia bacterium]
MATYKLSDFTLDEKLHLLSGKDNWHLWDGDGKLPLLRLADGPHGMRIYNEDGSVKPATAMPCLSAIGSTFNRELAYLSGNTIADECIEMGAAVLLAPGVNTRRCPLNGRNFEYFSEDPFLSGELGAAYIEGVQVKGIGTSLKHYCANLREYDRFYQGCDIDERALREIYLAAFEGALRAKPYTVMCSFTPINGVYASENRYLLKDMLRDEFGFDGVVISDWGAVHSIYKSVKAGLDLTMPYRPNNYSNLKDAYERGLLSEEEIDFCVRNILTLIERTQNDKKVVTTTKEERYQNAVRIAKEAVVLLKNEGGLLPLRSGRVLISGSFVRRPPTGGGGSSFVETTYVQRPLNELLNEKGGATYETPAGNPIDSKGKIPIGLRNLYHAAYGKDAVVLCVGEDNTVECESFDRQSIRLNPQTEKMILDTAEINENVVVLVYAGSAIDMSAWIDKVKAVVFVGYLGEGVNEALAAILSGEVSPSGKLTESFPLSLEESCAGTDLGNGYTEWFQEGIFVGYRYYDKMNKQVLFPFGHGLSYADLTYSNLRIEKKSETDYVVTYDIENHSDFDAMEASQVYVSDVFSMVMRPKKELKGFSKDLIPAHGKTTVSVPLNARSFAYYSTSLKDWHIENGTFKILVGASSRDIRLSADIEICLPDETQYSVYFAQHVM